jgi:hypothetical protein
MSTQKFCSFDHQDCHEQEQLDDTSIIERPWSTPPRLDLVSALLPRFNLNIPVTTPDATSLPCYRLWSFGFNPLSLRNFIDSIPKDILSVLQELFAVLRSFELNRISQIKLVGQMCANVHGPQSEARCFDYEEWESRMCDEEGISSYLSIKYDPEQMRRKNVFMNRSFGLLMGIHQEEALARFANNDVILPMPSEDFLCFLVDTFLCWSQPVTERYVRMHFGYNGMSKTVLLKESVMRTFNSSGELVQVINIPLLLLMRRTI